MIVWTTTAKENKGLSSFQWSKTFYSETLFTNDFCRRLRCF